MRAGPVVGLLVVVLIAAAHRGPDQPAIDAPESTHESAFTLASCDENDTAFDVEPDTEQAWADAAAWCTSSGEWLDNAPWPSGFRPAPLPIDISSGN